MGWGDALIGVGRVFTVSCMGVVGFAAGGPVGAVIVGIAAGAEFDMVHTAIACHKEGRPSRRGLLKDLEDISDNPDDPRNVGKLGLRVVGDGMMGFAAGNIANGQPVPGILVTGRAACECLNNAGEKKPCKCKL